MLWSASFILASIHISFWNQQRVYLIKRNHINIKSVVQFLMLRHCFSSVKLNRGAPKFLENANIKQKGLLMNLVLSNLRLKGSQLMWKFKKFFDTVQNCAKGSFGSGGRVRASSLHRTSGSKPRAAGCQSKRSNLTTGPFTLTLASGRTSQPYCYGRCSKL